jgi:integrase
MAALQKTGLDEIKPTIGIHDLRRLAATRIFADGVDLQTIMDRLGQKAATLAAEVYVRPTWTLTLSGSTRWGQFVVVRTSQIKDSSL